MRLWSIQSLEVWEKLQEEKQLYVNPSLSGLLGEPIFQHAYNWIMEKMEENIEGYNHSYPWWAWHTWSSHYGAKPDLRCERRNYPLDEKYVRLELEIPAPKVLLSDFDAFCCGVLNGHYLAETREKSDEWYTNYPKPTPTMTLAQLRAKLDESPDWEPEYDSETIAQLDERDRQIRQTWDKCLDIELMKNNIYFGGGQIQACFEVLLLEDVKKVTHFKGARISRC
jgi:hypothetical protein